MRNAECGMRNKKQKLKEIFKYSSLDFHHREFCIHYHEFGNKSNPGFLSSIPHLKSC